MKRFSTVRDTQRCFQSNMEKRRGRREIEVASKRRGPVKKGENIQLVISSVSALYSPGHPERFTELSREEKGRK